MCRVDDNSKYELFFSSDITFGKLFWFSHFDTAMVAFLKCLKEICMSFDWCAYCRFRLCEYYYVSRIHVWVFVGDAAALLYIQLFSCALGTAEFATAHGDHLDFPAKIIGDKLRAQTGDTVSIKRYEL